MSPAGVSRTGTATGGSTGGSSTLRPSGGDDTTAIQALIDAAATAGGGEVLLGAGTFIAAGLIIKSNVTLRGVGRKATVLQLKAASTSDLVTVASFATLTGGTTQAGPSGFALRDLCLDGNKANVTSGWPLRLYASCYLIDNLEVKNGKSGGVWSQWGTGGDDMEAHWSNFKIRDCTGNGLDWNGPHDSVFVNGHIIKATGKGIVTHGAATSEQLTNLHVWGSQTHGCHFLAPVYAVNCQVEGSTTANLIPDCNFGSWIGGSVFGTNSGAEVGISVGLDATARYWDIDTRVYNLAATGKPLNYVNSNKNHIRINLDTSTGTTQAVYGTPALMDHINIWCGNDPGAAADWAERIEMGNARAFSDEAIRGVTVGAFNGEHFLELLEGSVSVPSVDSGRLAVRDNGSGKSQLVVRFRTGAIQVLATEP